MPGGALYRLDTEGQNRVALRLDVSWNAWVDKGAGGGDVRRYTPAGRLDRRIQLPTLKLTSVMFGGPNLDEPRFGG